jgi:oligopeptide/dipeptide ABC transporter ATP-binding protein
MSSATLSEAPSSDPSGSEIVLDVRDLSVEFATSRGVVSAVDKVSFTLDRGEVVGLVGGSGSGKSVTALSLFRLVRPPGRITSGEVLLQGRDLLTLSERELVAVRGRRLAMVFQDPMSHLDPVQRAGAALVDALMRHRQLGRDEASSVAVALLEELRVPDPERVMRSYPHQLSGGMCQRVMIGVALASEPEVLVADEATSALDATVQASILATLRDLRASTGTSFLITTHSMRVVRALCTRTIVMYAGRIVETGRTEEVLHAPRHPYTRSLLDCMPGPDTVGRPLPTIPGDPPAPGPRPSGCAFAPRCPHARAACVSEPAELREVAPGRFTACIRAEEIT